MDVLIIDRDELIPNMIQTKLQGLGHDVVIEPSKDAAFQRLSEEKYQIIFIDPAPLTEARQIIFNIRRATNKYAYIVLMGKGVSLEDGLKAGANHALSKPLDQKVLDEQIESAAYMQELVTRIGDESEDFPSAGGVIAKSAFNQLFLSSLERSDRYGEQSFNLFISVSNYQEILETDGAYAADFVAAKLSQYLVQLRRQSDIIGQTAKHEYSLLLQRPVYESEPLQAANRFAQAIGENKELCSDGTCPVEITVSLVQLPTGNVVVKHVVKH